MNARRFPVHANCRRTLIELCVAAGRPGEADFMPTHPIDEGFCKIVHQTHRAIAALRLD